ncbi:MAG: hypothetical protein LUG16_01420 [Candidatus Gastranaerophilales bacterium]|nr:hypothetical protein [Candidatus Gastranaerophilales bacterium]
MDVSKTQDMIKQYGEYQNLMQIVNNNQDYDGSAQEEAIHFFDDSEYSLYDIENLMSELCNIDVDNLRDGNIRFESDDDGNYSLSYTLGDEGEEQVEYMEQFEFSEDSINITSTNLTQEQEGEINIKSSKIVNGGDDSDLIKYFDADNDGNNDATKTISVSNHNIDSTTYNVSDDGRRIQMHKNGEWAGIVDTTSDSGDLDSYLEKYNLSNTTQVTNVDKEIGGVKYSAGSTTVYDTSISDYLEGSGFETVDGYEGLYKNESTGEYMRFEKSKVDGEVSIIYNKDGSEDGQQVFDYENIDSIKDVLTTQVTNVDKEIGGVKYSAGSTTVYDTSISDYLGESGFNPVDGYDGLYKNESGEYIRFEKTNATGQYNIIYNDGSGNGAKEYEYNSNEDIANIIKANTQEQAKSNDTNTTTGETLLNKVIGTAYSDNSQAKSTDTSTTTGETLLNKVIGTATGSESSDTSAKVYGPFQPDDTSTTTANSLLKGIIGTARK